MLASSFLRADCWIFGRIDTVSSANGQGMFGFVDDGYRMARHLGTKRPQLPQNGCGWIAHAYQTMGGQRRPAVSAGMKEKDCPSEVDTASWVGSADATSPAVIRGVIDETRRSRARRHQDSTRSFDSSALHSVC